ncbi:MAG: dTDP-4-dehydrorhamnose 3,5-epimerase [Pikeienuella sp.]
MQIEPTAIADVKIITPRRFGDNRGWFTESFNAARMDEAGFSYNWVQDNHSYSATKGTLRGLHYQAPPFAQAKLVRVTAGSVLDVAVDIRVGSPSYLQWVAVELSAENGRQLLIPKGFLHGFITLVEDSEMQYKVDAPYSGEADGSVRFDDAEIGVDWGLDMAEAVLSDKDREAPELNEIENPFVYEGM